MKVLIKGKLFKNWELVVDFQSEEDNDYIVNVVWHYINEGYDVKVEQIKELENNES